jgi:hypothetical protein
MTTTTCGFCRLSHTDPCADPAKRDACPIFHAQQRQSTATPAMTQQPDLPTSVLPPAQLTATAIDHAAILAAITAPEPAAPPQPRGNSPINPDHYARFKIQPIQFARENNLQFWQANVVKYIVRADAKNGVEDIEKAIDFLMKERAYLLGDPKWFEVKWDHS